MHDGLGGVHTDGTVVELPDEVADAFIAAKLAVFVDGSSAIKAREDAKVVAEQQAFALQKRRAEQMMMVHDAMPKEVRELAMEHGDEAIEDFLAEQARSARGKPEPLDLDLEQPKRRRRKKGDVQ